MPLVLYDLPNALLGLLICSAWVLIGVGGYLLFQRVCRTQFAEGERNLAIALLAVIAMLNSLLLAFSAVSVWDAFGTADKAVSGEAVCIGELARDLAVFDSAEARQARGLLRSYGQAVLVHEWPAMQRAEADDNAWKAFDDMFRAVGRLDPVSARQTALLPEIWARTNELVKHRRRRLYAAEAKVPLTLWAVVGLGALLTIMAAYVCPRSRFHATAVAALSLSLGLVFFFVVAMDRPFAGTESIGPQPIQAALGAMDQWSAASAIPRGVEPPTQR